MLKNISNKTCNQLNASCSKIKDNINNIKNKFKKSNNIVKIVVISSASLTVFSIYMMLIPYLFIKNSKNNLSSKELKKLFDFSDDTRHILLKIWDSKRKMNPLIIGESIISKLISLPLNILYNVGMHYYITFSKLYQLLRLPVFDLVKINELLINKSKGKKNKNEIINNDEPMPLKILKLPLNFVLFYTKNIAQIITNDEKIIITKNRSLFLKLWDQNKLTKEVWDSKKESFLIKLLTVPFSLVSNLVTIMYLIINNPINLLNNNVPKNDVCLS